MTSDVVVKYNIICISQCYKSESRLNEITVTNVFIEQLFTCA